MQKTLSQVLVTLAGNLLVQLFGKGGGFIYMTPTGDYLPSKSEINLGKAININEWNFLSTRPSMTHRPATDEEMELAAQAIEKRNSLLEIPDLADRMQWVTKNTPQPKKDKLVTREPVAIIIHSSPGGEANTPFKHLLGVTGS